MKFPRWELRHTADPLDGRAYKGGSSSSASTNQTSSTTNNADKRNAVQEGVGISGDGNSTSVTISNNDPDAVKAMAQAGADIIKSAGGAIVDLNRDSLQTNAASFDKVVSTGAALVDKLIAANTQTTNKVVDSFKPTDAGNADVAKWVAAAAAIAAGFALS